MIMLSVSTNGNRNHHALPLLCRHLLHEFIHIDPAARRRGVRDCTTNAPTFSSNWCFLSFVSSLAEVLPVLAGDACFGFAACFCFAAAGFPLAAVAKLSTCVMCADAAAAWMRDRRATAVRLNMKVAANAGSAVPTSGT